MANKLNDGSLYKWRELIEEAKTYPPKKIDDLVMENGRRNVILPNAYPWFFYMDGDNHPDLRRFLYRLNALEDELNEANLFDEMMAEEMGAKIIIDKNPYYRKYPLIYVKDKKGTIYDLHELERSLLINMEIHVLDESIKNPAHVIALLGFYLEYPIRVKRIQKEHAVKALMKKLV